MQSLQVQVFSPTKNFNICVNVLRPAGKVYGRVGSRQITVEQNSTDFNVTANSIINVECGDRIAIDFQQCMTACPVEQETTRVVEYLNLTEGNTPYGTGISILLEATIDQLGIWILVQCNSIYVQPKNKSSSYVVDKAHYM